LLAADGDYVNRGCEVGSRERKMEGRMKGKRGDEGEEKREKGW
jgi:hypothetical protein